MATFKYNIECYVYILMLRAVLMVSV